MAAKKRRKRKRTLRQRAATRKMIAANRKRLRAKQAKRYAPKNRGKGAALKNFYGERKSDSGNNGMRLKRYKGTKSAPNPI